MDSVWDAVKRQLKRQNQR